MNLDWSRMFIKIKRAISFIGTLDNNKTLVCSFEDVKITVCGHNKNRPWFTLEKPLLTESFSLKPRLEPPYVTHYLY